MNTVAAVFLSRADAEWGAQQLEAMGVSGEKGALLIPKADREQHEAVPAMDAEQPGMGETMGAVVGGAAGIASGSAVGTAIASSVLPGVGPILGVGLGAAALLGTGGALAGAAAGKALENRLNLGLPEDEFFVYEDALRKGRILVIAFPQNDAQANSARAILAEAGAESIDSARKMWWLGLRDAERESYQAGGGDFTKDESDYRSGFEAALRPELRDKSYSQCLNELRQRYPDLYRKESFRRGYERGQSYNQDLAKSR